MLGKLMKNERGRERCVARNEERLRGGNFVEVLSQSLGGQESR